jgi:hypothetical protein
MSNDLFKEAECRFGSKVQSHNLMCNIYSAYLGPDEKHHNCLGDNFNDLSHCILAYLGMIAANPGSLEYHDALAILVQLVNSAWERISDVFEMISLPDVYKHRHYKTFIRTRRWANFFKHPKEFAWLVCFPQYCIEGSIEEAAARADNLKKVVDDEFVKKYYSAERQKGLAGEFTNYRDKVVVVLPNVVDLIDGICNELHDFVSVVTKNPVYFEILNDKATIVDYYERETTTTTTVTTTTTTTAPPGSTGSGY